MTNGTKDVCTVCGINLTANGTTCDACTHTCPWCGMPSTEEYCDDDCRQACIKAYEADMLGMYHETLCEAHGDAPIEVHPTEVCPVCGIRAKGKDMPTCLASDCIQQWDVAWAKDHEYTRVVD